MVFLAVSCRNALNDGAGSGGVPDTVSENVRQVTISPSGRLEITAEVVEVYKQQEISSFQNAQIRKYDEESTLEFEGRADSASFEQNGDGNMNGKIRIKDYAEDVGITAETLVWKQEPRMLTSDGTVTIIKKDFTITGTDFSADIARRKYDFKEDVTGRFNDTEEEETNGADETDENSETEQQEEP